jgi:hypothetical protein
MTILAAMVVSPENILPVKHNARTPEWPVDIAVEADYAGKGIRCCYGSQLNPSILGNHFSFIHVNQKKGFGNTAN